MKVRSLLLRGGRIIDASQGLDLLGDVLMRDGRLESVGPPIDVPPPGCDEIDAVGLIVSPGFIDFHCHLREPGYEDKETIATGTFAAARGGFTTISCMPNTNPAIDTLGVLTHIQNLAARDGAVRVLCIGAVTKGRLGKQMAELGELAQGGVIGFSDDGDPVRDAHIMRSALAYARPLGLPIINHCEDPRIAANGLMHDGPVATRLGLRGMPSSAEHVMAARDIALAELTRSWIHLAHVSTAETVDLVRQAKARGIRVTAEVTPHHLMLTDSWVMGGSNLEGCHALDLKAYDTSTKVNPPLRSHDDVAAVARGLKEGVIDIIATDHAPHTSIDKETTYDNASFGISVLETALGSLLSLVHRGELDLPTLVHRLTAGPAGLLGNAGNELGTLKPGSLADVVLFDPNAEWIVDTREFASKGKNTPLDGFELKGKVMATIVGGRLIYSRRDELVQ